MRTRYLSLALVLALIGNAFGAAQPPDGWAKVESLTPGSMVIVNLKTGESVKGPLKLAEADAVVMDLTGATPIAKSAVKDVRLVGKHSNSRGVGIGLGVGAGFGIAAMAAAPCFCTKGPGDYAAGALVLGGIGAAFGWLSVRKNSNERVIYRAPKRGSA